MRIDKISKLKDNKYKILIDDKFIITYDNVILENDLLYKKNINNSLYEKILLDTSYYEVYNKTVKYILRKRRSEKEILCYLNKFDIDDVKKDKIINKLKYIGLINDKEFCKAYINDKVYLGKSGINKIKKELLNQDIPINVIDEALKGVDEGIFNNKLESLIKKKINSNTKYSNNFLRQKVLNDMINMGYDREDILRILNNNILDDSKALNKEFNKLYITLSKKYAGNDLSNKIKYKLLSKGFKLDEINEIVQQKTEV